MESGGGFDNRALSNDVVLLKSECSSEVLDSLWVPNSNSPSFHGSASMVHFEESGAEMAQFYAPIDPKLENCNDDCDGCFHRPEKKRRLLPDQVQFLEKSFEVENKLEPERKVQLAKELGLQPRQVAIWFQNRRARYKTKLLEKEYDCLKSSYDKLRAEYDAVFKENEKAKNEVNLLTEKLLCKGKPADTKGAAAVVEGASSAKSDVVDSDGSPGRCWAVQSECSNGLESDEEESRRGRGLGPPSGSFGGFHLGKVEDEEYYDELQPNSCNLGFPVQNQGTWLWQI